MKQEKKSRIIIPETIAAEIQFDSDRTCCVCNTRGKKCQIHHIDENPSNNDKSNLSLLCFDCHNDTMLKGGFGRHLNAHQIILYRDNWHDKVKRSREEISALFSVEVVPEIGISEFEISENDMLLISDPRILANYLEKILILRNSQLEITKLAWSGAGNLSELVQANMEMILLYQKILEELASYYPIKHFNSVTPKEYFYDFIKAKFESNFLILNAENLTFGGKQQNIITTIRVICDLDSVIVDMIDTLNRKLNISAFLDPEDWKARWIDTSVSN